MMRHYNTPRPLLAIRYKWNGQELTRTYTRDRIRAESIVRGMRQGVAGTILMGWIEEVTDEEELKEVLYDER